MDYLALEIFDIATTENPNPTESKFAVLSDSTAITITATSEIFASGDVWSHSFQLNVHANAHIFGTTGDMHGSRLHEQIDKRKARLWAAGIPLYLGYLKLNDEENMDSEGNIDVGFESGHNTFDEMIEGAKANQVPLIGDVRIGMALWRKRWIRGTARLRASTEIKINGMMIPFRSDRFWIDWEVDGESDGSSVQQYPRMVFPKGTFMDVDTGNLVEIDEINTDLPYDESENGTPLHPYCNVALCYQQTDYLKKVSEGKTVPDYSSEPEAQRAYEYMPADRMNSAPNFYVLYWIRALMKHLGIHIEENQMMDVEDLRRLFFVNTNCDYTEPKYMRDARYDGSYGKYRFASDRLVPEHLDPRIMIRTGEFKLKCTEAVLTGGGRTGPLDAGAFVITAKGPDSFEEEFLREYREKNSLLHEAYATSECFPDADISEVISAIESGFGVRFLFSDDFQRVRIVLLRNLFQSPDIQDIDCEIEDKDEKVENNKRGFRLTYGKGTEDTQFYYKGFADHLPHKNPYFIDDSDKHDYSKWDLDADYSKVIKSVSAFDKTCYVTQNTGNAYGIKVDKDAKRYDELHPSLFGYADFMDAEDGNCAGEKETIEEITVGFTPAIMNDLNMEAERAGSTEQRFALFVDNTMRPRRPDLKDGQDYNDPEAFYDVEKLYDEISGMRSEDGIIKPGEFVIASDSYIGEHTYNTILRSDHWMIHADWDARITIDGAINEGFRLYFQDNYEPNDDGVSPIEKHDWGLMLGIMRGSGSDAHVDYKTDPDDSEGNDTWDIVPGSSVTAHPDTCNNYGKIWDYDGAETIEDKAEAISTMLQLWPDSNVDLIYSDGSTMRDAQTVLSRAYVATVMDNNGGKTGLLLAADSSITQLDFYTLVAGYTVNFNGMSRQQMMEYDRSHRKLVVETDSSWERRSTLLSLQWFAFTAQGNADPILIDNGTGTSGGRFSLKLRAEKPNPYYATGLPDIIRTKRQAGVAIKKLYTTSDTNLLIRPYVSYADMRSAGWEIQGDGDARMFTIIFGVVFSDGKTHNVLFTPFTEDGRVVHPNILSSYVSGFNGSTAGNIGSRDTNHLILDVNTTEERRQVLQDLMTMYYVPDGGVTSVDVSGINTRYLEITDPNLRGRGLCDTFYKEYSYWIRNARIAKRTVRMELAQLLTIDLTKKVRIGDITGFVRKMQYSVGIKSGLGEVTMEIMYI